MIQLNAGARDEGATKLIAFAVAAAEANWINAPDAESGEIVEHGSCPARLRAYVDDIVNRKAGFERDFAFRRINLQITVEAEITNNCDREFRIFSRDRAKAFNGHIHSALTYSLTR